MLFQLPRRLSCFQSSYCVSTVLVRTLKITSPTRLSTKAGVLNDVQVPHSPAEEASKTLDIKKDTKENKKRMPSQDILGHFSAKPCLRSILTSLPVGLLRRKRLAPRSLYLFDEDVAKKIVQLIKQDLRQGSGAVIEVNPGLGLLSDELLSAGVSKLYLFESMGCFRKYLRMLQEQHSPAVDVRYGDLFTISKLVYQDKLDNGTRVEDFLKGIEKRSWNDEPAMKLVGAVPCQTLIKHMILSFVFQSGFSMYGRTELYVAVPPPLYIRLTCGKEAGYLLYTATSVMFQLMFECKRIGELPRKAFLPWEVHHLTRKNSKLAKVRSVDPDLMYLVKITPRANLFETLVPSSQLKQFWYFVKHGFFSRKRKVIPQLEQWIPGCGAHIIQKQKINIFTEFGELTPQQVVEVFRDFRSRPEYHDSPFLEAVELSHTKLAEDTETDSEDSDEEAPDATPEMDIKQ